MNLRFSAAFLSALACLLIMQLLGLKQAPVEKIGGMMMQAVFCLFMFKMLDTLGGENDESQDI